MPKVEFTGNIEKRDWFAERWTEGRGFFGYFRAACLLSLVVAHYGLQAAVLDR